MFNNPMMYSNMTGNLARPTIFRGLLGGFRGINWSGLLSNTQKTLGIINQTIPIVYQVKPIVNNARTLFRINDALKSDDNSNNNISNNQNNNVNNNNNYDNKPVFYI